jgi:hypothetical protein
MSFAQFVLDCFPDYIAQHGLIGCGLSVAAFAVGCFLAYAIGTWCGDCFNISFRRVGGLRFLKLGRLTVSWSVSRAYRPL